MTAESRISPEIDGQRVLESLRQAVGKALERKRRLGQHAVVWKHERPVTIGRDASQVSEDAVSYLPD